MSSLNETNVIIPASMTNYRGESFETEGILSIDKTFVAIAIAHPGKPDWTTRGSNDQSSLPSRTNVYGDVTVYTFDNINNKIGTLIMPSRGWMIIQSKDGSGEREPFMRSCWTVKTKVDGDSRGLQPPTFSAEIQALTMQAIKHATNRLMNDIKSEKSNMSKDFAELAALSIDIANTLLNRKNKSSYKPSESSTSQDSYTKSRVVNNEETSKTIGDILG